MQQLAIHSWKQLFIYFTILTLAACNYSGNKSGSHYFLDMHDSLGVEAQEEDISTLSRHKPEGWSRGADALDAWAGPGSGIRVPPEGTVPRGYQPYPYEQADGARAGRELKNPLRRTRAVLTRGQDRFEVFCAVCHGHLGQGDGPVVPRFPAPPTLVDFDDQKAVTKDWSDGQFYHIITAGRGRMKGYAAQVSSADRWAIIHYVRLLQAQSEKDDL